MFIWENLSIDTEEILASRLSGKINKVARFWVKLHCENFEDTISSLEFKHAFIEFLWAFSTHVYSPEVNHTITDNKKRFYHTLIQEKINNQGRSSLVDPKNDRLKQSIRNGIQENFQDISAFINSYWEKEIYLQLNKIIQKISDWKEKLSCEEYIFMVDIWEIIILFFKFSDHYKVHKAFVLPTLKNCSISKLETEMKNISQKIEQIYANVFSSNYFYEKIYLPYRENIWSDFLKRNPKSIETILNNIYSSNQWNLKNIDFLRNHMLFWKKFHLVHTENNIQIYESTSNHYLVFHRETWLLSDIMNEVSLYNSLRNTWYCKEYLSKYGYIELGKWFRQYMDGRIWYNHTLITEYNLSYIEDFINLDKWYVSFSALENGIRKFFLWRVKNNFELKCVEKDFWWIFIEYPEENSRIKEVNETWMITQINIYGRQASMQEIHIHYNEKWQIINIHYA